MRLLRQMLEAKIVPSNIVISLLMNMFSKKSDQRSYEKCQEVFSLAKSLGVRTDNYFYSMMIDSTRRYVIERTSISICSSY